MKTARTKFLGQIASAVQDFVQIGDVVIQIDPLYSGLPGPGVRVILLVCSVIISFPSSKTYLLRI